MHKVLVITEEGRGGGALGRIKLIAEELQGQIHTTVLAPSSAENYIKKLKRVDIHVVSTRLTPLTTNFSLFLKYVLFFPFEVWSIRSIVKEVEPDLVHCNGSWQIKGFGIPN